jgi:hypothetical protein
VTDARLTLLPIPGQQTHYNLACVENGERIAFELHGVSERLFVRQAIEVVGDHCPTVSYAYRYQVRRRQELVAAALGVLPRTAAPRLRVSAGPRGTSSRSGA